MLKVEDRIAINELLAMYGHLMDQRRWNDFGLVMTEDVEFIGVGETTNGLANKIASWTTDEAMKGHPLGHHVTNVVISEDVDGVVRVISKGIGIKSDGVPNTVTYEDVVTRTLDGWRISRRKVTRRTVDL